MTRLSAAGAKTSMRSPHQQATPHQIRGSATHPDATKLVMTARKSISDSQPQFTKPRSESQQQTTTHKSRALPRHPDGAWRWTTPKQARRARVHAPERSRKQRPSKFTKQRHLPRCHEARAISGNDALTMERCNASGWNQTRTTHQARHLAPHLSKPCHQSPAQRSARGCHEARLARMPKRMAERRCPTRRRFSSVTRRKAPAANRPGTTCQVAGIKNTKSRKPTPSIKKYGAA